MFLIVIQVEQDVNRIIPRPVESIVDQEFVLPKINSVYLAVTFRYYTLQTPKGESSALCSSIYW